MDDIIRTLDDITSQAATVQCPFCGRLEQVDATYPAAKVLHSGCTRCAMEEVDEWLREAF